LNAYIIFIIFTQGTTINKTIQVGGAFSGRFRSGRVAPEDNSIRGRNLGWEVTFSIDVKGERFIKFKIKS
jgi:hypothetical protein